MRALIAVGCFASAYMAEVVRGGLQAIPAGQFEASEALGLSYYEKMRFLLKYQLILSYIFLKELITTKVLISLIAVCVGIYFVRKADNKKLFK